MRDQLLQPTGTIHFNLRTLLLAIGLLAVPLALIAWRVDSARRWQDIVRRSRAAKAEIQEICRRHGGHCTEGLVTRHLFVNLDNAHLECEEMSRLSELFLRIVSEDLDDSGFVDLSLHGAKFDGKLADLVNERVIGLALSDAQVDDDDLLVISHQCPRLDHLNLTGSQLTDRGLQNLASMNGPYVLTITRQSYTAAEEDALKKALPNAQLRLN